MKGKIKLTLFAAIFASQLCSGQSFNTPEEAARSHHGALMSLDNSSVAKTSQFPFVHIQPDGSKYYMESAAELPELSGLPYRSKITELKTIEETSSTAVVRLVFRRTALQGEPAGVATAYWGAIRSSGTWLISWRHLLQVDTDA